MLVTDLRKGKKKIKMKEGTVFELLEELGENTETVLVSVNNRIATEDQKITEKDDVKIIPIVSGG